MNTRAIQKYGIAMKKKKRICKQVRLHKVLSWLKVDIKTYLKQNTKFSFIERYFKYNLKINLQMMQQMSINPADTLYIIDCRPVYTCKLSRSLNCINTTLVFLSCGRQCVTVWRCQGWCVRVWWWGHAQLQHPPGQRGCWRELCPRGVLSVCSPLQ